MTEKATRSAEEWTLGVEEEYQIIDPGTRQLCPREAQILPKAEARLGDQVTTEFHQSQIEIATPVCGTLADVRAQLKRARQAVIEAAGRDGRRIAAAGTHPFSESRAQLITEKPRYEDMAEQYQALAHELVIFGCHVHVALEDQEAAIGVLNRTRHWLAPLLALSASSPFWDGKDTGYASYRTELWVRWPMAGPPGAFADRAEYEALVAALVQSGSISDPTKIYWDVRLPAKTPTLEFRVADVCPSLDDAVLLAGLARGLVRTFHTQVVREEPFAPARPELIRAAHWRAARYGLEGELMNGDAARLVPAPELVQSLLALVRPALEEAGDWDEVSGLTEQTLRRGNGAMRQRAVFARRGNVEDVVNFLVQETAEGIAKQ